MNGVMFALLALFWGGSFVSIDVGLHHFPPLLFAAVRYDVAGLLILGYAAVTTDRWKPQTRGDVLGIVTIGAFIIAGHHSLLYLGQEHVPGALAAVIVSLSPVLTAVFASTLFADEHVTPLGAVGLLCGVVGVAIVANPTPANLLSTDAVGIGLVFLAAASFALGSVLTRPFETGVSVPALQGWSMLFGSVLIHAVSLGTGESPAAIDWSMSAVASLTYLVLISGVVAFLIYFHLLDTIGATELNLVGYLEPVVATLLSWLVLGELVASTTVIGFAAIFTGFALLKRDVLFDFWRAASPSVRRV
ncbi:EamA family transporter (plasmid) [Haladaptatus sp. SPP-AMP-3]